MKIIIIMFNCKTKIDVLIIVYRDYKANTLAYFLKERLHIKPNTTVCTTHGILNAIQIFFIENNE